MTKRSSEMDGRSDEREESLDSRLLTRARRSLASVGRIGIVILMLITPLYAQNSRTQLISINRTGTASANFGAAAPSVTPDGRYIAFASGSNDLIEFDFNNASDVFVRDRQTNTTAIISVALAAPTGNGLSVNPVMTPDGRYVAFSSQATNLVTTTDTNNKVDAFVRDRQTGTTSLISFNSSGMASGNDSSAVNGITPNGRYVLFSSYATNLVSTTDTNGVFGNDIFVRDRQAGTTTLVTVNSAGTATGNNFSLGPVISDNGRYVAFWSFASDLVTNDTNGFEDIFVRDLQTGATSLVSINMSGTASGNDTSELPIISPDGRYVVFDSFATDLVPNDNNNTQDLFRRDLLTGTTTLVSINMAGTASGNSFSYNPVINSDGRYVAFVSAASDLAANDTNGVGVEDVFVRDMQSGATTLVSLNGDGSASANGSSASPLITPDGRFVAFMSFADNIVAVSDRNDNYDVFVRDRYTGATRLVSLNSAGSGTGNNFSGVRDITPDGRKIVFQSDATDLVNISDTNNAGDIFFHNATISASDFDDDGKSDISVFRPSSGTWYFLRSSNSSFGAQAFGTNGDRITPGDYDGDRKTDLAVFRPANGTWYILRSSNNSFVAHGFGLSSDLPAAADYDGDSKTDIAVFRPSNGTWYILQSSNGALRADPFGADGDLPVPGDYDGDGRSDVAVFRPSNGVWYLLQSTAGFTAQAFGQNEDKPVQGDYDGDRKTDLAVFRPSNGTWYLLRSTAGYAPQQFGLGSDVPAPGDFDADGKTDVAVFRPSNGVWYLQRSSAGFSAQQFGSNGDVPVPSGYLP